jgi:excisionase family DNA binding protein
VSLEETIAEVVRRVVREELAAANVGQGPDVLSTEEAAERAGVTAKTVRAWIAEGRLPAGKRGQRRTIQREDLDRFLAGEKAPEAKGSAFLRRVG